MNVRLSGGGRRNSVCRIESHQYETTEFYNFSDKTETKSIIKKPITKRVFENSRKNVYGKNRFFF